MHELSARLWIPFQVGFEYQKSRRNIIEESISSLHKIKDELIRYHEQSILEQAGIKKHLYNRLSIELTELQKQLKQSIDSFVDTKINTRITSKQAISHHDMIRDRIDEIIGDKVGSLPSQDTIDAINKKGDERYEKKIPPGFKDIGKKKSVSYFSDIRLEDKFGDLYLWEQLIDKAAAPDIKSIIFVTDDAKDDWVFIHKGKNHGPLEALKTEICKRSGLEEFRLVNQLAFLSEARKYLKGVDVSNDTLNEVKEMVSSPIFITYEYENPEKIPEEDIIDSDSNLDLDSSDRFKVHHINHFNKINVLLNDSQTAIEDFESLLYRSNKNLDAMRLFDEELSLRFGIKSISSLKEQLSKRIKMAQIVADILEDKKILTSRHDKLNVTELTMLISDLVLNNSKLIDINEKIEHYLNSIL
ncbi:hypothetical protein D9T11_06755 [Enterobacter kobei]|nr:hypothetical protein D9T11_06755 [Enterobacter kobei]